MPSNYVHQKQKESRQPHPAFTAKKTELGKKKKKSNAKKKKENKEKVK